NNNNTMKKNICIFIIIFSFSIASTTQTKNNNNNSGYYRAAVIEYKSTITIDPKLINTSFIQNNLDDYYLITKQAAEDGAQIIVFPEYGLYHGDFYRDSMLPFLEVIPDPSLSSDPVMLAKYRKTHLYFERSLQEHKATAVTFDTSFGVTFGIMICSDINYKQPLDMILAMGVRNVILSSAWYNFSFLSAIEMAQAWSYLRKSTLLLSGIGSSFERSGTGIFSNGVILASAYNPTTISRTQILIIDVPIDPSSTVFTSLNISGNFETDNRQLFPGMATYPNGNYLGEYVNQDTHFSASNIEHPLISMHMRSMKWVD
ncbi:hypothetical protein SAMD00019534_100470, partial [Acytostelium subglobosum LB1]|uniref:hypothetical protein n=1 Tax=Acytostelium subglobosum LB1 TaxID=1410327 RepID=UPI000644CAA5